MPEKWENKAKELGALTREREIKSAFDFLWMAFLYMAEGESFGGTSALSPLADIRSISEKAAFAWFQKREERL
jgi:hypothetical protein